MGARIRGYGVIVLCVISLFLASCGEEMGGSSRQEATQPYSNSNGAGLRVVLKTDRLSVTEAGTVEIQLDNAVDLYGLHLSLQFDPGTVRVRDINPVQKGIQIAPGVLPAPDFTVVNRADNERGVIEYAVTQLYPREPARGNGTVATIRFEGVGTGVSPLQFSYIKLAGPDGREIPVQVVNEILEVDQPEA